MTLLPLHKHRLGITPAMREIGTRPSRPQWRKWRRLIGEHRQHTPAVSAGRHRWVGDRPARIFDVRRDARRAGVELQRRIRRVAARCAAYQRARRPVGLTTRTNRSGIQVCVIDAGSPVPSPALRSILKRRSQRGYGEAFPCSGIWIGAAFEKVATVCAVTTFANPVKTRTESHIGAARRRLPEAESASIIVANKRTARDWSDDGAPASRPREDEAAVSSSTRCGAGTRAVARSSARANASGNGLRDGERIRPIHRESALANR